MNNIISCFFFQFVFYGLNYPEVEREPFTKRNKCTAQAKHKY